MESIARLVDAEVMEEKMKRVRALVARASYEEGTRRYWMDAADWDELRDLVAVTGPRPESNEHRFAADEVCPGCGMTENYFRQAMAILRGWPEDSEKEERMAELRACKGKSP